MHHTASVVFPVEFDDGEHLYRVHFIQVQLVKEEHGCDSDSESLEKHEPRRIFNCHIERRDQSFVVAERTER